MLRLVIQETKLWDERKDKFITIPPFSLSLEHSLIAISKWESIWEKPFLEKLSSKYDPLTVEQIESYIQCMSLKSITELQIKTLTNDHYTAINDYLMKQHTATTIQEHSYHSAKKKQIWTSELLYYNIFANQIPIEVERWNLNRLLRLFDIFRIENQKNDPKNKNRTPAEINKFYESRESLNARRKAEMKSKG